MTCYCGLAGNESVTETRYLALQLALQLLLHFSASARCRSFMLNANFPDALERVAHTQEPLSTCPYTGAVEGGSGKGGRGGHGGGGGGTGGGAGGGRGGGGGGIRRFQADVLALLRRLWTILLTAPPSLTPPSSPSPETQPAAAARVVAPQLTGKEEAAWAPGAAKGGVSGGEMATRAGREKAAGGAEEGRGVRRLEESSPARPASPHRDWQGEEGAGRGSGMMGEAGRLGLNGSRTRRGSTQTGNAEEEEKSRGGDGGGWRRQGKAGGAGSLEEHRSSPLSGKSEKLAEEGAREAWGRTVEKQQQEFQGFYRRV